MIDPGLDDDRRQDLLGLLRTYVASFSKGTRLGKVRGFKATIPLKEGSNAPLPQPNRPQGPAKGQVVDEFIDQMLSSDVIEDSVMNRPEPSPAASLQVNMDLSPSLVPCFCALVFALAIYILALAYAHVAGTF
jgi:hypothetical protein